MGSGGPQYRWHPATAVRRRDEGDPGGGGDRSVRVRARAGAGAAPGAVSAVVRAVVPVPLLAPLPPAETPG
ncbi:hypothetical protein [Nocardiopsis sp. CC223A]|uniref:hypothetical protein n=1 Tax=Nocardiopsis sp. CC223A TaxID=3044051 RepID=UPI00278BEB6B|nr:hypothetical protein [Nocardiopsis sp. CC223A]